MGNRKLETNSIGSWEGVSYGGCDGCCWEKEALCMHLLCNNKKRLRFVRRPQRMQLILCGASTTYRARTEGRGGEGVWGIKKKASYFSYKLSATINETWSSEQVFLLVFSPPSRCLSVPADSARRGGGGWKAHTTCLKPGVCYYSTRGKKRAILRLLYGDLSFYYLPVDVSTFIEHLLGKEGEREVEWESSSRPGGLISDMKAT